MTMKKNSAIYTFSVSALYWILLVFLLNGCASTTQFIPKPDSVKSDAAHITVKRSGILGFAVSVQLKDGPAHIGKLGPNGVLTWDRPPGVMRLTGYEKSNSKYFTPLDIVVQPGESYVITAKMLTWKFYLESGEVASEKSYEQDKDEHVELIVVEDGVRVRSIDDGHAEGKKLKVKPGPHTIGVFFARGNKYDLNETLISFEAAPGGKYLIGADIIAEGFFQNAKKWRPWVKDGFTGMEVGRVVETTFLK